MFPENPRPMAGSFFVILREEGPTYPFKHGRDALEGEVGYTLISTRATGTVRWRGWSSSERPAIHGDTVLTLTSLFWKILAAICSVSFRSRKRREVT